jgi:hypothetical protein
MEYIFGIKSFQLEGVGDNEQPAGRLFNLNGVERKRRMCASISLASLAGWLAIASLGYKTCTIIWDDK